LKKKYFLIVVCCFITGVLVDSIINFNRKINFEAIMLPEAEIYPPLPEASISLDFNSRTCSAITALNNLQKKPHAEIIFSEVLLAYIKNEPKVMEAVNSSEFHALWKTKKTVQYKNIPVSLVGDKFCMAVIYPFQENSLILEKIKLAAKSCNNEIIATLENPLILEKIKLAVKSCNNEIIATLENSLILEKIKLAVKSCNNEIIATLGVLYINDDKHVIDRDDVKGCGFEKAKILENMHTVAKTLLQSGQFAMIKRLKIQAFKINIKSPLAKDKLGGLWKNAGNNLEEMKKYLLKRRNMANEKKISSIPYVRLKLSEGEATIKSAAKQADEIWELYRKAYDYASQ
jgi:hypothetical protein